MTGKNSSCMYAVGQVEYSVMVLRNRMCTLRITKEEHEYLVAKAAAAGLSISEYCRRRVMQSLKDSGKVNRMKKVRKKS